MRARMLARRLGWVVVVVVGCADDTGTATSGPGTAGSGSESGTSAGTTAAEGTSSDGTASATVGSTDSTTSADGSSTETGCTVVSDDPSGIGMDCELDEQCLPGYTCQSFEGIVVERSCEILCEADCECPMGYDCVEVMDKVKTWQQCMMLE
ncbi:MAG: hypothetical protein AB1Z98_25645 [Nannocystaceae bacterium]